MRTDDDRLSPDDAMLPLALAPFATPLLLPSNRCHPPDCEPDCEEDVEGVVP